MTTGTTSNNSCIGPGNNIYIAERLYSSVSATGALVSAIDAPTDISGGITLLIKAAAAATATVLPVMMFDNP